MRTYAILIVLLIAMPLSAQEASHEEARFVMGTLARVSAWADNPAAAKAAVDSAYEAFEQVEARFSTWRTDSELSQLNAKTDADTVAVSSELAYLLGEALRMAALGGGAFDPTVLPLVKLWGFREDGPVESPSDAAVAQCLERVGYLNVTLLQNPDRVAFTRPDVELGESPRDTRWISARPQCGRSAFAEVCLTWGAASIATELGRPGWCP